VAFNAEEVGHVVSEDAAWEVLKRIGESEAELPYSTHRFCSYHATENETLAPKTLRFAPSISFAKAEALFWQSESSAS
jgi:hypothetical protein